MTVLDKIDGLELLKQHGVHVARSKYADSAEDAIAFSQRRIAADERLVPVVLRGGSFTSAPVEDEAAIRAAYAQAQSQAQAQNGGVAHHVIVQNAVSAGTEISILGLFDPKLGSKVIVVRAFDHEVRRMVPIGEMGAEALVSAFRSNPRHAKTRKMIEHLLLRLSDLYTEEDVEEFELDPVRLHEDAYTVLDATLRAKRTIHVPKRLGDHDRKVAEYRPSGTQ